MRCGLYGIVIADRAQAGHELGEQQERSQAELIGTKFGLGVGMSVRDLAIRQGLLEHRNTDGRDLSVVND